MPVQWSRFSLPRDPFVLEYAQMPCPLVPSRYPGYSTLFAFIHSGALELHTHTRRFAQFSELKYYSLHYALAYFSQMTCPQFDHSSRPIMKKSFTPSCCLAAIKTSSLLTLCSHSVEMDTRCSNPSSPIRPLSSFLDLDTLIKCSEAVQGAMVDRWRRMTAASNRHSYSGLTFGQSSGTSGRMVHTRGLQSQLLIIYAIILVIIQYVFTKLLQVNNTCEISWGEVDLMTDPIMISIN